MDPFLGLIGVLQTRGIRFVVVGVWGANLWARDASMVFTTEDCDLFIPPDPANTLAVWRACESMGLSLWVHDEPLDIPRDETLARAVVDRRALVRATGPEDLLIDLTYVMASFDFETVWRERKVFVVDGVDVPVARLTHIVRSKAAVGRAKDRLFLATHAEALEALLRTDQ